MAGPPKPEAAPAQTAPAAAATPEPERPPILEILPDAERKRLQESAAGRRREIHRILDPLDARKLSDGQRALTARIRSFLQLSDDAEGRGDMRQADALAERAQVLVQELQGGR